MSLLDDVTHALAKANARIGALTNERDTLHAALKAMVERDERGGGAEGPTRKAAKVALAMVEDEGGFW